MTDPEPA